MGQGFSILQEVSFCDAPKLSSDIIDVTECVLMDLGVDVNLASLWEVSNIHPAFEEKENANEKRKKGESKGTVWQRKNI